LIVCFLVDFLVCFYFFEDILCQVSAVFLVMMYVWFWRSKENPSKVSDGILFLATVLFQQEQVFSNPSHAM